MKYYEISIIKVIDGDSLLVNIDLGFDIILKNKYIRLNNIDTPESRTKDLVEKYYGNLAKEYVNNWCKQDILLVVSYKKYTDKFGRILGDLCLKNNTNIMLSDELIKNYHAVYYKGDNKDNIKKKHLENRKYLPKCPILESNQ